MKGVQILIVEDESIVAKDIQTGLMRSGYTDTLVAANGADGIRMAADCHPDLVLMDITLGKGMLDGFAAAERIKELIDIPVVYLTGRADEKSLRRASITKPYGYLIKPFQTRELVMAVEIAISRHGLERRLRESNDWLSTILASIGDGVVATDAKGRIRFVNKTAEALFGKKGQDMVGEDLDEQLRLYAPVTGERIPGTRTMMERTQEAEVSLTDVLFRSPSGVDKPVDVTLALTEPETESGGRALVCVLRDIGERKLAEEYIRYLAYHDALTGLPNRMNLFERFQSAMTQSRRHGRNLAVLFLDLDDFKIVNDTLGHASGDALLRDLALRLRDCVRTDDTVARLAGDEFIIILNDVASASDVEVVAGKILERLGEAFQIDGQSVSVTASVGISLYPLHSRELDDLIRYADTAMYLAKQRGKSAYVIYNADWKAQLPASGSDGNVR
ncbi:MAG: diguanylate cyclase [Spirochaetia bacterium]|nr:diguanylate cyclase [Spirochaetia bacterium]